MDLASKELKSVEPRTRKRLIRGMVLTLIGGALFLGFNTMIGAALRSQLVLTPDNNEFTSMWLKAPLPIGLDIYLFNLENPDEFLNGAKAKVKEMGPYSYNLGIYHEIISFNTDKTRLKYWEVNSFDFLPDDSPRKLSDKITTVNFPVYALGNMVREMLGKMPMGFAITPVAFGFVNLLFASHGEGLIKRTTVGELLNGYPFGILQTIDTLTKPLGMFGIQMPDTGMPENKFGFLWTKNHTRGGPFESWTGLKGSKVLDVYAYKGEQTLPYYNEASCNHLGGTEGTILEPLPDPNKVYQVFNMATCKTFELSYVGATSFGAIPTYRFQPTPEIFASPNKNPKNRCFCYEENQEWCDGAFDLSRCLDGAPVAYSFPHFMGAGNFIKNNVDGLSADPELHTSFLDIEKHLGSPLKGSEKLQMNGILKPIPYLAGFRNFQRTLYPLLWMKKSAELDDAFTMKIRMAVYPLYVVYYLGLVMLLLGLFMVTTSLRSIYKKRGQVPSSPANDDRNNSASSVRPLKLNMESAEIPQKNLYPDPVLDSTSPRLVHRRPSFQNQQQPQLDSVPKYHPPSTIRIEKPPPHPRNGKVHNEKQIPESSEFEASPSAPPNNNNNNIVDNRSIPNNNSLQTPRQQFSRSATPGDDRSSVSTFQVDPDDVDDLDQGWTSINDIVDRTHDANPESVDPQEDAESKPARDEDDSPQPIHRKKPSARQTSATWSHPGSLDEEQQK